MGTGGFFDYQTLRNSIGFREDKKTYEQGYKEGYKEGKRKKIKTIQQFNNFLLYNDLYYKNDKFYKVEKEVINKFFHTESMTNLVCMYRWEVEEEYDVRFKILEEKE